MQQTARPQAGPPREDRGAEAVLQAERLLPHGAAGTGLSGPTPGPGPARWRLPVTLAASLLLLAACWGRGRGHRASAARAAEKDGGAWLGLAALPPGLRAAGTTTTTAAPAPVRVACVGDSITFGLWASSPTMSYPLQLQQMLGPRYHVMNFGESGATLTTSGFKSYWDTPRFKESLLSKPDIVVIMLGTNDAASGVWCNKYTEFVPIYDRLIKTYLALESRPKVFVADPPPIYNGSSYASFFLTGVVNGIYPELLPQIACAPTIPLHGTFLAHCPVASSVPGQACDWLVEDGVHPNDAGYGTIAKAVLEAIVQPTPPPLQPTRDRAQCLEAARWITVTEGQREAVRAGACAPAAASGSPGSLGSQRPNLDLDPTGTAAQTAAPPAAAEGPGGTAAPPVPGDTPGGTAAPPAPGGTTAPPALGDTMGGIAALPAPGNTLGGSVASPAPGDTPGGTTSPPAPGNIPGGPTAPPALGDILGGTAAPPAPADSVYIAVPAAPQ